MGMREAARYLHTFIRDHPEQAPTWALEEMASLARGDAELEERWQDWLDQDAAMSRPWPCHHRRELQRLADETLLRHGRREREPPLTALLAWGALLVVFLGFLVAMLTSGW